MSISFPCTGCGRTLKVADELAGRKAKCPQCQAVLYIPEGPAAAITPAPTAAPMRRRAAPLPEDEPDAGADMGEEMERRPRRRKKAKKSMLVPVLIAVAAGVLLLGGVTVAAFYVVPMLFGGGSEDLYFMPDNVQMVGQVRVDQVLNSDALKQVWTAFPDAKSAFDKASSQESGVESSNLDRMYFGTATVNFSGSSPPAYIVVLHFKSGVKIEDLEAGMKKSNPNLTFTDTKVGKYTMIDVKAPPFTFALPPLKGQPAPPPPAPASLYALCMPNDKEVVMGTTASLQAVLTRDKKPDVNDRLMAAIKSADFNATVAFAANVKDGLPQAASGAGSSNPLPMGKVDGVSATIKVGSDVDVSVTALCQDATAAGELSGGLKTAITNAKQQYGSKLPPELADLLNMEPQVSGSNVTIAKTIKVAPLINLVKNQQKGGGFNPFSLFGK